MKKAFNLNDYIEDIELNGMRGRMVNAPARKPKAKHVNILFVHGHHSSLERLAGVAELLSVYGNFCLPDMPGFGGMEHLYKVGLKPSIDNLADYMAAFIKLQYGSRKKVVLVGYSMGFLVVTRMLQKYPELNKQIVDIVAIAGFVHHDDLKFTTARRRFYMVSAYIMGSRPASWFIRELFMRKWFLGTIYTRLHNAKDKFTGLSNEDLKKMVNFEVKLWRINHVPTWCYTTREMLKVDLITEAPHIPLNLIMVTIGKDRYFDNASTEQHMRIIFNKVRVLESEVENHGGSVVATADDARVFMPQAIMNHLRSLR